MAETHLAALARNLRPATLMILIQRNLPRRIVIETRIQLLHHCHLNQLLQPPARYSNPIWHQTHQLRQQPHPPLPSLLHSHSPLHINQSPREPVDLLSIQIQRRNPLQEDLFRWE